MDKCMLCIKLSVQGTALCKEHLEGFKFACVMLTETRRPVTAKMLLVMLQQLSRRQAKHG